MRYNHYITGVFWIGLYILLSVAPLGIILFAPGEKPPGRSFWVELSVALGFVGLAMMTLQFALTARISVIKAPYGSDVVYSFHKVISIVSIVLIALHPLLLFIVNWPAMKWRWYTHPIPFWTGTAALLCLIGIAAVSVYRQKLKLDYVIWRRTHAIFGTLAVALAVFHILYIDHYTNHSVKQWLWLAYTLAFVGLVAYVRLIRPVKEIRTPYRVVEVKPERGNAWTLAIEPVDHPGIRFAPGQFAWITVRSTPFSDREHPFSFSGSSEKSPRLEFTIKNVGDFTGTIPTLKAGETVYISGPFGALSADRHPRAQAFVLVAGGIGITPMMSHIRTFRDRSDPRPLVLFYGAKDWDSLTYREELEELKRSMPTLKVVYVLNAAAPAGVEHETGFITTDLLRRHLPKVDRFECFICGPQVMMDAVERCLHEAGVPLGDFHSERFNLV